MDSNYLTKAMKTWALWLENSRTGMLDVTQMNINPIYNPDLTRISAGFETFVVTN